MMGRWLKQLQKNPETPEDTTDKTDKTSSGGVLSVLSVRPGALSDFSPRDAPNVLGSSVSFVSSSYGRFQEFNDRTGWDDEDWQATFNERAAILEFDAGLSREEAERSAKTEIDALRRAAVQCRD